MIIPVPKKEKPLDNKRYPSSVGIAIQENIELNKMMANQQTNQGAEQDTSGIIGTIVITKDDGTKKMNWTLHSQMQLTIKKCQ